MGKVVEEAKTVSELTEDEKLKAEVDELATLMAWAAKQKKDPRTVRLAELMKKFKEIANNEDHAGDETVVFAGEKFRYSFGKPSQEREVTEEGKEKFANKVGEKAFLEVVTVPLGAIDKYIPKVDQDEYLDYSTGARTGKMEQISK
jgi:hypothetical protein